MLRASIKVLLRGVPGTHRQWGSTDSQLGAAGGDFYSCMTTLLLELEAAKVWKRGGRVE